MTPSPKALARQLVERARQDSHEGNLHAAERELRLAVTLDQTCIDAWTLLTECLWQWKRNDEGIECLKQVISLADRTASNFWVLAEKSCRLGQYEMARALLSDATMMNPQPATLMKIQELLVQIEFVTGDWGNAIERATRILELEPNNLTAISIRQQCYFKLCWTEEDVADSRRFIDIRPDAQIHSKMIWSYAYLGGATPETMFAMSREWNDLYAAPLAKKILAHENSPAPERRLRVGYLSPDLYHHPMLKLLPGVLKNHDAEQFEIFVYSITAYRDETTEIFESLAGNFIELPASREAVVNRVRADGIDILVDLAHRTMKADDFLVFAQKPAPVQCTWMGFLATTGLSTMDYFIGDQYLPCPGTEHLFSERVYRLPRIHSCYSPAGDAGIVTPPYFRNGYLTFGSFNDPRKIHRDLVKIWAVILHLHPGSKLLLKYWNLNTELGARRIREWFVADGIGVDRLEFEGLSRGAEYFACWNKIDLQLDSFPYNGGTTTMDALWMGVPVISLAGRMTVASCSMSLLSEIGMPVASRVEEYVALAAQVAKSIPSTPDIRARIREAMVKSRIMDSRGLVKELETAYRNMWRTWCSEQKCSEQKCAVPEPEVM